MGFFDRFRKDKIVDAYSNQPVKLNNDKGTTESFTTYRNKINIWDQQPRFDTQIGDNFVHFYLEDNLMPQKFNQLYNSGPTVHADCINTTVDCIIGGGISFENYDNISISDKSDLVTFRMRNKLDELAKQITMNYKIHNRINIRVKVFSGGLIKFEAVDPEEIRYDKYKKLFWHSEDWNTQSYLTKGLRYEGQTEPGIYYLEYDGMVIGTKPYALPRYNSGLLDIVNAAEIPLFHRANMDNSVNPGLIVTVPFIIEDPKQKREYISQFSKAKGSSETGRTTFLFANGIENVPIITQVNANPNDKQFEVLTKNSIEQICFAHQMNPSILGAKTAGSLGMNQELLIAYQMFQNIVVKPMRVHIEHVLNDLYMLSNLNIKGVSIKVNDFELFDTSLLNPNNNEVLEETTEDVITEDNIDEAEQINESLRGLTAAENTDIYRIIRDHDRGKINDIMAIARLRSYGIPEDKAKEILGIK